MSEQIPDAGSPEVQQASGTRDVSPHERAPGEEVPPEQSAGAPETNPDEVATKAGYPSHHPKSAEHPWKGIDGEKGPQSTQPD
ncbi:MAG: hypothetical protein CMH83_07645 [Nocardioides sp.]|nr:hypothetical protein [Nocardioides sp.]